MSDPLPFPAPTRPFADPSTAVPASLEMVGSDPAAALPWFLRALDLLVRRQATIATAGLPAFDEDRARARIARFVSDCVQPLGDTIDAPMRRLLDDSLERIVQEPARWPMHLMHARFTPGDLQPQADGALVLAEGVPLLQGPIVHDIASLLRGGAVAWEEDFVLDLAIRYWERARKAGLPVDADFGAFYRGVEWMGLLLLLARLGALAQQAPGDTAPDGAARSDLIRLAHASASRYIELKPLQRVLERITGAAPQNGYAFGRV